VFTEPSHGWKTTNADTAELTASNGGANDYLGDAVAVSGPTIVAGARQHGGSNTKDFGAAYVFK
jgi:hypothetical protein